MIIVCRTDLSDRSRPALVAAASFASRIPGCELYVTHVLDAATTSLDMSLQELIRSGAVARLKAELANLNIPLSPTVHPTVLTGPSSKALLEFARAKRTGLLIVASEGHGASPLYRLGGTSERLAQAATQPLLVVRDATPFKAWADGTRALRVLLAVDWTRSSAPAIEWVKTLRAAGPCDVVVGYIYYSGTTGEGVRRYGLARSWMFEPDPEVERLLERDLRDRVGELGGTGRVSFRAHHGIGRLGDHLLELAESEQADLIVVGTHHKRGLSRLSSVEAVALHFARSSMAVVPSSQGATGTIHDEVPVIRRVLIATDLSPLSNVAIPAGYGLLGDRGGEAHLVHILPETEPDTADSAAVAQLRSLVPRLGVSEAISTRAHVFRHANPAQAIRQTAERLGVDAICIASHGRSGISRALLGSVAEAILREAECPVLIVRSLPQ